MTHEEIRVAALDAIRARGEAIAAELETLDALPDFTDEQRAQWQALTDEVPLLEERRQDIEARTLVRSRAANLANVEHSEPPQVMRRTGDPFDLSTIRISPFADPRDVSAELRGRARTAIEQVRWNRADDAQHATRLVDTIDEKGNLARRILTAGSPDYERSFSSYLAGRPLGDAEARALSVGTDASGGFAVPVQLDPTIISTNDFEVAPIRQIARVVPITTKTWQGVTSAGVTAGYAAEAAESGDDAPTLAQPTVDPERADVFIPFSYELDQDWGQIRTELAAMISEAKADLEADKFITGAGSGSNEPEGVVDGLATSSHVNTATTDTFAVADLYSIEEALPPRYRARARILANKVIFNDVRQFGTSDSHALWERIGAGQPPLLLGYPAHEASAMDSTTTTGGELIMLIGDFSRYLIVDRVGMSVELVPHLFATGNNRPTGQRGLYAFWRNSAVILADDAFRLLRVKAS